VNGKLLLSSALIVFCLSPAFCEETDREVDPAPVREVRPGVYVGVASCANGFCHGSTAPKDETSVLQNEYPTWMLGPHRGAFRVLRNELSQAIAKALDPDGKPAHERDECLACHALVTPPGKSENVFRDDGISCEACHGPAGGWRDQHFEEDWTYQKSLDAGMRDLRDAKKRAGVCLECHLGAADRKVDHRLIAAGHPRLYFELDNYAGKIPRHWKVGRSRSTTGVRAWAVGQVASFRAALVSLERYAGGDEGWPEFSEYNCQSCHHSLASNAWRKQAGYRFQGGYPPYVARYAVLRQLVAELDGGELDRFDAAVDDLVRAASSFRSRQDVAARAKAVTAVLDEVEGDLTGAKWKGGQVRSMMRRIAKERADFLPDLVAAEQAAFALQSLLSRWVELDRKVASGEVARTIDDVFASLDDPDAFDRGRFEELLARLEGQL